ncbi:hypothetical protein [Hydrogenispora ethanolica]
MATAIGLEVAHRPMAQADADFWNLRDDPAFKKLMDG